MDVFFSEQILLLFFSSSRLLQLHRRLLLVTSAELKWTDAQADHILTDLSHLENKVRLKIKRLATKNDHLLITFPRFLTQIYTQTL